MMKCLEENPQEKIGTEEMSSEDKLFWKRMGPMFYHNHHGTCETTLLALLSHCIEKPYTNLFPTRVLTRHGSRSRYSLSPICCCHQKWLYTDTHTCAYKKHILERKRGYPSSKMTLTFPFVAWSGSRAAGTTSVGSWWDFWPRQPYWKTPPAVR